MIVKYLMLIDASCGYHNLELDEKSLYLMRYSCPFGKYWYIRLLYRTAVVSNMFQRKIQKLFSDIPHVFGIADDILTVRFDADGRDCDKRLE